MRTKVFLITLTCLSIATASFGQNFYVGGNIGNAFRDKKVTDLTGEDFELDENAFAWKAYAGIDFGFFAIEGGYHDFGEVERTVDNVIIEDETKGWDAFGKGAINLAFLEFFGKAGVFFENTDQQVAGNFFDKERTNFAWGFGAGLNLGRVGLRLEWENFEVNPDKLSMLSAGATITLGNRDRR